MSAHDSGTSPDAGNNADPAGLPDPRPAEDDTANLAAPSTAEMTDAEAAPDPDLDPPQPADPATASDPAGRDVLTALAAELTSRLDALGVRLDDAVIQREGFDRLYDDFDRCRKQESVSLVLPWINGLIRLHDNIGKTRDALTLADPPQSGSELAERQLAGVRDELEVLLGNNGVTLYREPDERFNSRRQSVIALVPTAEPEQDGRIAARVRPGFELGERLLRKERVRVYKHRPEPPVGSASSRGAAPDDPAGPAAGPNER